MSTKKFSTRRPTLIKQRDVKAKYLTRLARSRLASKLTEIDVDIKTYNELCHKLNTSTFKSKFVHDEETLFKVNAKRNKLLGEWVADKLNKTDKDKEDYILEVIKSDMAEPGDEDVFRKVKNDLSQASLNNMDEEIRNKMIEFMESAKKAIL